MTVKYGLTIENTNLICQKAKEKADGVYTFRGVVYRVKDKRVSHFAYGQNVFEFFSGFLVLVGTYTGCYDDDAKRALKTIK